MDFDQQLKKVKGSMKFERTVVLVKPDGVQRGLIGKVLTRFEEKGLKLVGLKLMNVDDVVLESHYSHLKDKPFFQSIKDFMKSSPVVAMVWEGVECIQTVRTICGTTNSREATPGTIRGDFGMGKPANIIHSSDTPENAEAEIVRFFDAKEIYDYDKTEYMYVYWPD